VCEGLGTSRLVFGGTALVIIDGSVKLPEEFADAFFARNCAAFLSGYDFGAEFFGLDGQLL